MVYVLTSTMLFVPIVSHLNLLTDNSPLDPGVLNNGDGEVVAIYDWETYAPPSTNGAGGLGFIGMQVSRYR